LTISEEVAIRFRRLLLGEHHLSDKGRQKQVQTNRIIGTRQIKFFDWQRFASHFHLLRPEFKVPEVSRTRPKKAKAFDAVNGHILSDKGRPSFF